METNEVKEQPTEITEERLQFWELLCQKATPGPWYHLEFWPKVWHIATGRNGEGKLISCHGFAAMSQHRDADFAAEARTALPLLLGEVRRLREEVETWEKYDFDRKLHVMRKRQ